MVKKARFIVEGQIAENRRARFDYSIGATLEAGLALSGDEVKSLREGRASIGDGFAEPDAEGFVLKNVHIGAYEKADGFKVKDERRPRRLLLHAHEIRKLFSDYSRERATIVPLKLYFNKRGLAKILLGLGQGKNKFDKRETIKRREWDREKRRIMKLTK